MDRVVEGPLTRLLGERQAEILEDWVNAQVAAPGYRRDLVDPAAMRSRSGEFMRLFTDAVRAGGLGNPKGSAWHPVRDMLAELARDWTNEGVSPREVATFVFSLKLTLFDRISELETGPKPLSEEFWRTSTLLDDLGLHVMECVIQSREQRVHRQQEEIMELSTPVVRLWEGVVALPLIGTLDSARTEVVMESLLQRIVETDSAIAIIDITGVPTVDTLTAQHLIKTVTAARLMGADCIISGIRPHIAQTIVHLGVDLTDVTTKATLADALRVALQRNGFTLQRTGA